MDGLAVTLKLLRPGYRLAKQKPDHRARKRGRKPRVVTEVVRSLRRSNAARPAKSAPVQYPPRHGMRSPSAVTYSLPTGDSAGDAGASRDCLTRSDAPSLECPDHGF